MCHWPVLDGAKCHTSNLSLEWIREMFGTRLIAWPPRSLDEAPCTSSRASVTRRSVESNPATWVSSRRSWVTLLSPWTRTRSEGPSGMSSPGPRCASKWAAAISSHSWRNITGERLRSENISYASSYEHIDSFVMFENWIIRQVQLLRVLGGVVSAVRSATGAGLCDTSFLYPVTVAVSAKCSDNLGLWMRRS